jgi:transposase-like protein
VSDKKREKSSVDGNEQFVRGRPGRRSAAERREAVMALIAGKASVDQLAKQYGVLPSTVEGWRDAALLAIEQAMTMGASTPKERELEAKVEELEVALKRITIEHALAMNGVEEWKKTARPTRPARSRR